MLVARTAHLKLEVISKSVVVSGFFSRTTTKHKDFERVTTLSELAQSQFNIEPHKP
jgi:hypothetical protein